MKKPPLLRTFGWLGVLVVLAMALGLLQVDSLPLVRLLGWGLISAVLLVASIALIWALARRFLWRVGRRLAFSYFLIGVLPIPMVALMVGLGCFLLSGYFMGHLYRTAAGDLAEDLERRARVAAAHGEAPAAESDGDIVVMRYEDGRLAGPSPLAGVPEGWPAWMLDDVADGPGFVLGPDGAILAAAAVGDSESGVVAMTVGDLGHEFSHRTQVWVSLLLPEDRRRDSSVQVSVLGREYFLSSPQGRGVTEGRAQVLGEEPVDPEASWLARIWRSPWIWWGEVSSAPLRNLADGEEVGELVAISLNSSPSKLRQLLSSPSAEINTAAWVGLISIAGLLATLYGGALVMALFIIFGLSRAVDQLSKATDAIRAGRFETRMRARRNDQIGELQSSVNHLAGDLERLVASEASKEVLEKELLIARDLQQSLLPQEVPSTERVEFTTLFEPSAAIGGDYFDILRIDADRIAVVIADVSGHGLPSGLRMAMFKAALVILVEEGRPPEEILRRLHAMVRAEKKQRFFVTATVAVIDFRAGTMDLTNAGHPPTYLCRGDEVDEILLPGSPLGALGGDYGRRTVTLHPGDTVVWLSDGLIEATDNQDEPFGYDRLREVLRGGGDTEAVRQRVVQAVESHVVGRPIDDDRTLVVMRYRSKVDSASSPSVP